MVYSWSQGWPVTPGLPSVAAASLGLGPALHGPGLSRALVLSQARPIISVSCAFLCLSDSLWLFLPGAQSQGLSWPVSGVLGLHICRGEAVPFLLWCPQMSAPRLIRPFAHRKDRDLQPSVQEGLGCQGSCAWRDCLTATRAERAHCVCLVL